MKPALILGLALAANAMAADSSDNNELFVAPQGKLAEFAKRHPEIKFDEQADDELAVKYVHLPHIPAPEAFAYDDEFLVRKPREESKKTQEYMKTMGWTRPEFDDDELLVAPTRDFSRHPFDAFGHVRRDNIGRPVKPVLARFDEVADDELAMWGPAPEQYQRLQNSKNLIYSKLDEVADDEFVMNQQLYAKHIAYDDNEFFRGYPPVENFKSYEDWLRFTRKMSDEADDELAYLGNLLNERAENPSHGKTKEKAQMKRKLRPIVDELPLAQN